MGTSRLMHRIQTVKTQFPPRHFSQIKGRQDEEQWREAYAKEIASLLKVGDMQVVPRVHTSEIIPIMDLFTVKYDNVTGNKRYKVRKPQSCMPQLLRW